MKPRLISIFLLIVLAPLILLAWIGTRIVRDEQETVERRVTALLTSKLEDVRATVRDLIEERQRNLLEATEGIVLSASGLHRLVRTSTSAGQAFLLNPKGDRIHPPPAGSFKRSERLFLERAQHVWQDKHIFSREPEPNHGPPTPTHGWYAWYWGRDTHVLFWRRYPSGHVVGIELDRVRFMSDIVAELPDSGMPEPKLPNGRIALLDANGKVVYQWGSYDPADIEIPRARLSLDEPLSSWRLDYFVSSAESGGEGLLLSMVTGLLAVGTALVGLATYFYREHSRDLREAAQRVSFVNQVSHELKTPLTNIRMYGELLQSSLPEDDEKAARYTDVIVAESQRLSRLIGNVLTFGRRQRDALKLHRSPGVIDDTIRSSLDYFTPLLEGKGVQVETATGAPALVQFDADAVEQILGNLFGNVEKYAASGGCLEVRSTQDGDRTTIVVSDRGPGIPEAERETVFRPFRRLSSRLTDGVTGAGIGLSIARDLARLHGGDLMLAPTDEGACFELTLHAPVVPGREAE